MAWGEEGDFGTASGGECVCPGAFAHEPSRMYAGGQGLLFHVDGFSRAQRPTEIKVSMRLETSKAVECLVLVSL